MSLNVLRDQVVGQLGLRGKGVGIEAGGDRVLLLK
jgi:hypothetical protein